MSNWWVISWLIIDYWRWSMSNRSPKILWPIDYLSMTSITHWCNWLLIDDPSITHRLLCCARKTLFLLSCTIFFVCDSFMCWTHFSLYLNFLLTMSSNQSENETNKYADTNRLRGYRYFLWVFVSKVKLLRLRETSVISSYITSLRRGA